MTKCNDNTSSASTVNEPSTYYFDNQIGKYLIQVMAVFGELYVKTGKREDGQTHFIHVPVVYGSKDRVTASSFSDNTQNKPVKLPMISVYKTGLTYAPDRAKGIGTTDKQTFLPQGASFPDGIQTMERRMPVPYDMTVEVCIFASNTLQSHQIIEQITMLFDPILQIQVTDKTWDWERITTMILDQIYFEENYPSGVDPRAIITPLQFTVPVWISLPKNFKNNFVEKLRVKLAALPESYNIDAPLEDYINDPRVYVKDINVPSEG